MINISTKTSKWLLCIGATNQSHEDLIISVNDEHAAAYDDFRLCVNESLIGRKLSLQLL